MGKRMMPGSGGGQAKSVYRKFRLFGGGKGISLVEGGSGTATANEL